MRAIDVHVHPSTRGLDAHACSYFRRNLNEVPRTEETFSDLYIKHDVKAFLIGWHPSTVKEGSRNSNDHVIDLAAKYPDAFAGILASLDINAEDITKVARNAQELARHPKVVGFKFHPPDQGFYPSDRKFYAIWEVLQACAKPVMFHVGFTVLGANTDGGSGIQDKTLFGTDFPYVDLEKALLSFEKLNFKQTAKDKILFANAQALFGF